MKTYRGIWAVAVLLAAAPASRACINEYEPGLISKAKNFFFGASSKPSKAAPVQTIAPAAKKLVEWTRTPPAYDWASREKVLRERASKPGASFQTKADLAAALLHLGRTPEAIAILEPLHQAHPNEYRLIATLGTAYELDGKPDRALEFIKKAMEINPKSHEGTEWLHVKILEAKIALQKDPAWLQTHTVLGYKPAPHGKYWLSEELIRSQAELTRAANAILYQLHERLQFVRPPDPTVADLLFDMAGIYMTRADATSASPLYDAAVKFGYVTKRVAN